jgi:tetratricopeptide (TPR) repeat protein
MVTLEPGDLPAQPELHRYMDAAAGLEALGAVDAAQSAYEAASRQWPAAALPRLGLANVAHGRGELADAVRLYREALERDPGDVAARNNLADTLLALGCRSAAAEEIARAQQLAHGGALAAPVAETAARIAATPVVDDSSCAVAR